MCTVWKLFVAVSQVIPAVLCLFDHCKDRSSESIYPCIYLCMSVSVCVCLSVCVCVKIECFQHTTDVTNRMDTQALLAANQHQGLQTDPNFS